MVDHRFLQQVLRPGEGVGIGALAGEEQRTESLEVVLREEFPLRVLLLDRAKRGRRREHRDALVLGDHAPERAGVGRAHGLPFVKDRGAAVEQRRVDDVAVADHPADVGGGPVHLPRLDAVEVPHRPFERNQVAAVVAHHALGPPGGARGVEDVERVGGRDRHAIVPRARDK